MPRQPDARLSWATLHRKITDLELIIKIIIPSKDCILALLMLPWLRVRLRELLSERRKRLAQKLDWQTRLRPRH